MFNFSSKEKKNKTKILKSIFRPSKIYSILPDIKKTGIKVLKLVSQILILLWRKESKCLEPRKVIIAPSKTP